MVRSAEFGKTSERLARQEWEEACGNDAHVSMANRMRQASSLMSLGLTDGQIECAIAYSELLLKWNRHMNLTAIRTLEGIVIKHFLDSLAIIEHIRGQRIIDIGSGAGFPGIAVALVRPNYQVVLLDAKSKKVQFLRHAIAKFGFDNVEVVHQRIQNYSSRSGFDTALVRSLGSLSAIAEFALPVLSKSGRVIAMKGKRPEAELAALKVPCRVEVKKVDVPYLDSDRHCVILEHPIQS